MAEDSTFIDELKKTRKCHWECPPDEMRSRLAAVKSLDEEAENLEKFWLKWSIGLGVAAFALIVVFFFLNANQPAIRYSFILMVFVACLAGALFSLFMKTRSGRQNYDNRRYLIADELLRHLERDMPKEEPLELSLDFNNYQNSSYRSDSSKGSSVPGGGGEQSYALPWLSLKGRFVDGTRCALSITQTVKVKKKSKRKYTKVKEAFREKVSLTLQVRPKYADVLESFPKQLKSTGLGGLELGDVRVNGTRAFVKAMTDSHYRVTGSGTWGADADQQTSDQHTHLQLLLACFDSLGRCRAAKGLA